MNDGMDEMRAAARAEAARVYGTTCPEHRREKPAPKVPVPAVTELDQARRRRADRERRTA